MNLALVDARDPDVERIWRALESQAQPSYFLTWGWISNWLAALPVDERPALAVLHDGRDVSAAFFLAQRRVRRSLVLQKSALFFNATGSPRHDRLGIARNAMLAVPGARRSLTAILDLLPADWDELHLPALDRRAFQDVVATSTRYQVTVEREQLAPYVDLHAPHAPTMRGLRVEIAHDLDHAMDIYGELLRLQASGEDGVLTDAWCDAFHRQLIRDRLPHGDIQLARVCSGETTIGCLYNFVHAGRVIAYESGCAALANAGALAHAAVIAHDAALGLDTYHLVGSQTAYAAEVATDTERLAWLRIERPLVELTNLEEVARRWYAKLVGERVPSLALT